jgi:hypothetical protein
MGDPPGEIHMLPPQPDQFPLTHRGLKRQTDNGKEVRVSSVLAGSQEPFFLAFAAIRGRFEAPLPHLVVCRCLDVPDGIGNWKTPLFAGNLEQMRDDHQISFDGRRRDGSQAFINAVDPDDTDFEFAPESSRGP